MSVTTHRMSVHKPAEETFEWEDCQRIGNTMADEAIRIIGVSAVQNAPVLRCTSAEVTFPVDNETLWMVIKGSPDLMTSTSFGRVPLDQNDR